MCYVEHDRKVIPANALGTCALVLARLREVPDKADYGADEAQSLPVRFSHPAHLLPHVSGVPNAAARLKADNSCDTRW
jgi:hypothetical protein